MFEVIVGTAVLIFVLAAFYFISKYASHEPSNKGKVITARDIIEMKERENNFRK